jgi:AbrB family looped-hinge helix DNA binding protein
MEATVDKFGRVVLPKRVRDRLGLHPGSVLVVEEDNEVIRLRPVGSEEAHVVSKGGVLVFSGKAGGDVEGAVRSHREQRSRRVAGRLPR